MDLKKLNRMITLDDDCKYLWGEEIIRERSGNILDTTPLAYAINGFGKDPLSYWVNDCIGRGYRIDDLTEEQVLEYLKLKLTQTVILSKFLEKLNKGLVLDFRDFPHYDKLKQNYNLPAWTNFKVMSIISQFETLTTSSFMVYTIDGKTEVDDNVLIEIEFRVPLQLIAVTDRAKYSSLGEFAADDRYNSFDVYTTVYRDGDDINVYRDTVYSQHSAKQTIYNILRTAVVTGHTN